MLTPKWHIALQAMLCDVLPSPHPCPDCYEATLRYIAELKPRAQEVLSLTLVVACESHQWRIPLEKRLSQEPANFGIDPMLTVGTSEIAAPSLPPSPLGASIPLLEETDEKENISTVVPR